MKYLRVLSLLIHIIREYSASLFPSSYILLIIHSFNIYRPFRHFANISG
jgi:hypothetical protein